MKAFRLKVKWLTMLKRPLLTGERLPKGLLSTSTDEFLQSNIQVILAYKTWHNLHAIKLFVFYYALHN